MIDYYTAYAPTFARSLTPFSSGETTQVANGDGSVTVSINAAAGYADSGFVIYDGKLGDLDNFSLTGTGAEYGLNLWFDVDNNGEYFVWDGSNLLTGLGADKYILGPSSVGGVMNITDSSPFTSLQPGGGDYNLAQLKAGAASDITSDTNVAIWVGVCCGGTKSATISPNFVLPSSPAIISPANNSVLTSAALTKIDWTDSTGTFTPITYQYQAFSDAGYTSLVYPSGWLALSEIPTLGTLEGVYFVQVRAQDTFGNVSAWSNDAGVPYKITVDNTAPDVEITSPADGSTVSGIVDVQGTVTDANPHHYWLVIQNLGGTTIAGPGVVNDTTSFTNQHLMNWDTTLVPDGQYTIKLEAHDAAGNKDGGSVDWHVVTVDNDSDNDGVPNGSDCNPLNAEVAVTSDSKACKLFTSGVSGNGILNAPGLQNPFNSNSQAGEKAGKKN